MPSGTVALVNSRLSLVAGTAFVDFGAAGTLTPYLNGKLTVTDSAGKKAIGYLKAAGTGETLGDELVTNGDFASATGWTISGVGWGVDTGKMVATNAAKNTQFYRSGGGIFGMLVKNTIEVTDYTSGTCTIAAGWTRTTVISANGTHTQYGTSGGAGLSYVGAIVTSDAALNAKFDNCSSRQVLTPSVTGATITSTRGETTYDWESVEAGFDYKSASGYTYEIALPRFKKSKFISQYNYFYRRNR